MENDLIYKIGITQIPLVGDVTAKNLIAYCGSAEAVFKEKKQNLLKIPGIGEITADAVVKQDVFKLAEKEIGYIIKNHITPLYYTDKDYPLRLKQCDDGPIMIYYRGNEPLNYDRVLAVVGTRRATSYGKKLTDDIVYGLKDSGVLIISGLAFGIDICAHRSALDAGLKTIGVVAHGLDTIYPPEHANTAKKMEESGGVVSEFLSGVLPVEGNFPRRNRIIAGMADATLVVESKEKGGALITAEIAFSYSREVLACPGRTDDTYSKGCNNLIQRNKAYLVQSAEDIIKYLGWESENEQNKKQAELFHDLQPDEKAIVEALKANEGPMHIDDLALKSKITPGNLPAHLLSLEFAGILISLPGKMYSL